MPNCIHHYIFPRANGPTPEGVCSKCGAVKECKNSFESTPVNPYVIGKMPVLPNKPNVAWTWDGRPRESPIKSHKRKPKRIASF